MILSSISPYRRLVSRDAVNSLYILFRNKNTLSMPFENTTIRSRHECVFLLGDLFSFRTSFALLSPLFKSILSALERYSFRDVKNNVRNECSPKSIAEKVRVIYDAIYHSQRHESADQNIYERLSLLPTREYIAESGKNKKIRRAVGMPRRKRRESVSILSLIHI